MKVIVEIETAEQLRTVLAALEPLTEKLVVGEDNADFNLSGRIIKQPMDEPLIDAHDMAKLVQLDASYIHLLARTGRMPSVKIGKDRKFIPAQVRNWLAEHQEQADKHRVSHAKKTADKRLKALTMPPSLLPMSRRKSDPPEPPRRRPAPLLPGPLDEDPPDPPPEKAADTKCAECKHANSKHARNGGQCLQPRCPCFRFK